MANVNPCYQFIQTTADLPQPTALYFGPRINNIMESCLNAVFQIVISVPPAAELIYKHPTCKEAINACCYCLLKEVLLNLEETQDNYLRMSILRSAILLNKENLSSDHNVSKSVEIAERVIKTTLFAFKELKSLFSVTYTDTIVCEDCQWRSYSRSEEFVPIHKRKNGESSIELALRINNFYSDKEDFSGTCQVCKLPRAKVQRKMNPSKYFIVLTDFEINMPHYMEDWENKLTPLYLPFNKPAELIACSSVAGVTDSTKGPWITTVKRGSQWFQVCDELNSVKKVLHDDVRCAPSNIMLFRLSGINRDVYFGAPPSLKLKTPSPPPNMPVTGLENTSGICHLNTAIQLLLALPHVIRILQNHKMNIDCQFSSEICTYCYMRSIVYGDQFITSVDNIGQVLLGVDEEYKNDLEVEGFGGDPYMSLRHLISALERTGPLPDEPSYHSHNISSLFKMTKMSTSYCTAGCRANGDPSQLSVIRLNVDIAPPFDMNSMYESILHASQALSPADSEKCRVCNSKCEFVHEDEEIGWPVYLVLRTDIDVDKVSACNLPLSIPHLKNARLMCTGISSDEANHAWGYVRRGEDWHRVNDCTVVQVPDVEVKTSAPYLLIYHLQDVKRRNNVAPIAGARAE